MTLKKTPGGAFKPQDWGEGTPIRAGSHSCDPWIALFFGGAGVMMAIYAVIAGSLGM